MSYFDSVQIVDSSSNAMTLYLEGTNYVAGSKLFGDSGGFTYPFKAFAENGGGYVIGSKLFGTYSGTAREINLDGNSSPSPTEYYLGTSLYAEDSSGSYSNPLRSVSLMSGGYGLSNVSHLNNNSSYYAESGWTWYDGSNTQYFGGSKLFGANMGSQYPVSVDTDGSSPSSSSVYSIASGSYGFWNYSSYGPMTSGTVKIKADYDGFYHVLGTSIYGADGSGFGTVGQKRMLTCDPDLNTGASVYSGALRVRTDGVYAYHTTSTTTVYASRCRIHSVIFDYDGIAAGSRCDIEDSSSFPSGSFPKIRLRASGNSGNVHGTVSQSFTNGVYMGMGIGVYFSAAGTQGCTIEYSY